MVNNPETVREHLRYANGLGEITKNSGDGTYTYLGRAVPGTLTSTALWQIKRITDASGDVTWADGNSDYDNVWDNIASLSYS